MSRYVILSAALLALVQAAGCGQGTSTQNSNNANSNTASTASTSPKPAVARDSTAGDSAPVASAHRSANTAAPGAAAPSSEKPDIETKELDAEIASAEQKAKASGASEADKRAAAAAHVKRGNVYYAAGQPRLYKFALGDFRRALRYQPDNAEAREKMDTIVSIYESMGRPVPTNGTEP